MVTICEPLNIHEWMETHTFVHIHANRADEVMGAEKFRAVYEDYVNSFALFGSTQKILSYVQTIPGRAYFATKRQW